MIINALAFSPHPDDAEMGCGGLLLKLKDKGYSTGIVDLTEAELSTNGDPVTRKEETKAATELLRLDYRKNLCLEDSNIKNDRESRLKIISVLRVVRPSIVLYPYCVARHPDHENSHKLIKDSVFISGLVKLKTDAPAYRPAISACYMLEHQFKPSFIVDITGYYDKKMEACRAYKSQFYGKYSNSKKTFINTRFFQELIESRDKCYGLKIRTEYGEPYFIYDDIKMDDPVKFFDYLF
jgi:bacillithiol biosynthesis deacetylase BshB1